MGRLDDKGPEENPDKQFIGEGVNNMLNEIASGLLYTHTRITDNARRNIEASSFLYALVELLNEKGVISIEELDGRKMQVAERLVQKFAKSGLGLICQTPEYDKYAFAHQTDVDCQSRLPVCKAVCCKFPFALSRQDVEEGLLRWEFGRPYLIAHDADGYCAHLDRETYRCSAYDHRPVPCRGFSCRDNERWPVWTDYNGMILNEDLLQRIEEARGELLRNVQSIVPGKQSR